VLIFEFFYEPPEVDILDPDPPVAPYVNAPVEIKSLKAEGQGRIIQIDPVEDTTTMRLVISTFDVHLAGNMGEDVGVRIMKEESNGRSPIDY
jgi:hypothetical protein